MKYKIQDLIDLNRIKEMFLKFYDITAIPLSIVDNNGVLLVETYQQDVCKHFHKVCPETFSDCVRSDSYVAKRYKEKKGTIIYSCPRGLTECAIPIVIENKHLANIFMGQFFTEKPNLDFYRNQAKKYGYNEEEYIEAVTKVPVLSIPLVTTRLEFIKTFVDFIAETGLERIRENNLAKQIKRGEEEIIKREQYKLITENSSDIISLIDTDNKFVYVSPACKKISGFNQEEIMGKPFANFIHVEDLPSLSSLHNEFQKRTEAEYDKIYTMTFRLLTKDGSYTWVESKMHPIFDDITGKLIEIHSTTRDISLQKRMNEELIEAKNQADRANAAKSEFLANMSHEIRTPLNAVIGFSELLEATNLDSKQKSYVEAVNVAGKSLLMLINDILDLSKIEAGRMEIQLAPVNVKDIFTELEQIFIQKIRSKNLTFILDIDPNLPQALLIDEARLRQILLNLTGNAVKFTDNGEITLRLQKSYKDINDGSRLNLVISVTDTGIGIPEDAYERIFESFKQQSGQSTRKYGGTGLGLSITKKLVEMMNGKISVTSVVGKGSTFKVELFDVDVAASHAIPEKEHAENSNIQFEKATILVADDVESNRILIKEILSRKGIDVITVENGYEAVITAKEIMPSLILMDIRMPVMDGFEAYAKLKEDETTKHIPVIALTASTLDDKNPETGETILDGFLPKPVSSERLFDELKKYIATKNEEPKEEISEIENIPMELIPITGEFVEIVSQEILPICKRLNVALKISQAKGLRDLLVETGEKYNQPILSEFGKKLSIGVENFDVEIMKSIINKTTDYLETLITKGE